MRILPGFVILQGNGKKFRKTRAKTTHRAELVHRRPTDYKTLTVYPCWRIATSIIHPWISNTLIIYKTIDISKTLPPAIAMFKDRVENPLKAA